MLEEISFQLLSHLLLLSNCSFSIENTIAASKDFKSSSHTHTETTSSMYCSFFLNLRSRLSWWESRPNKSTWTQDNSGALSWLKASQHHKTHTRPVLSKSSSKTATTTRRTKTIVSIVQAKNRQRSSKCPKKKETKEEVFVDFSSL